MFASFDKDDDGILNVHELNDGLESIGTRLTQRQLTAFKKNVSLSALLSSRACVVRH